MSGRATTTARTPFLGGWGAGRSLNQNDARVVNLYLEIDEGKDGKQPGKFLMAPGLTLMTTIGLGPIRGLETMGNILYAVSGNEVFALNTNLTATLQGTIGTSFGPVSVINNGYQLAIFDGQNGYLAPAGKGLVSATIGSGGTSNAVGDILTMFNVGGQQVASVQVTVTAVASALSGGVIGGTMAGYAIGDEITLANVGGSQTTPAVLTVTAESGGAVTGYSITTAGQFPTQPTSFTQASTTGFGTGFTFGSPLYITGVVTGFSILTGGSFVSQPVSLAQGGTTGNGTGFTLVALNLGGTPGLYLLTLPSATANNKPGPVSATYQDGFGIINQFGTQQWYQSNLNDLSIWQPLNFSSANSQPDNVIAVLSVYDQVYLLKQTNTEVWVNAGLPDFAFQKVAGVLIEVGILAPASLALAGNSLMFLAQNSQGERFVVELSGYTDKRVSTHAIEYQIGQYSIATDAIGYAYEQEGHTFYVLTFPTGDATWVYDVTASRQIGYPVWHQRAAFLNGQFHRHWGNAFTFWSEAQSA